MMLAKSSRCVSSCGTYSPVGFCVVCCVVCSICSGFSVFRLRAGQCAEWNEPIGPLVASALTMYLRPVRADTLQLICCPHCLHTVLCMFPALPILRSAAAALAVVLLQFIWYLIPTRHASEECKTA